jgi:hypothetical protein
MFNSFALIDLARARQQSGAIEIAQVMIELEPFDRREAPTLWDAWKSANIPVKSEAIGELQQEGAGRHELVFRNSSY